LTIAATFSTPNYECSGYKIPLRGHPFAVPCSSSRVGVGKAGEVLHSMADYNSGVEMAELQVWVGKTLDTSKEENRRLFLDYPTKTDENGNKVPDKSKPLQPVPPNVAAKALGKQDILLHGSNNWKRGYNSGTSGVETDADGNTRIKPEGQFQRVAMIEKFKPDPKLNK